MLDRPDIEDAGTNPRRQQNPFVRLKAQSINAGTAIGKIFRTKGRGIGLAGQEGEDVIAIIAANGHGAVPRGEGEVVVAATAIDDHVANPIEGDRQVTRRRSAVEGLQIGQIKDAAQTPKASGPAHRLPL